jgi:hypothetical protein
MRATRRWTVAIALALQLVGCGVDHMGGGNVAALSENIQAARTEVTRHDDAIESAQTIGVVPDEVERYETKMGNIMSGISSTMGGMMSHCGGSGMGTMHGMMDDMTTELSAHRTVMSGETELAGARSACTAHVTRMKGMLDGMHSALGSMGCMMGY